MKKFIYFLGVFLMLVITSQAVAETATRLQATGLSEGKAKALASDQITVFKVVNSTGTPKAFITPSSGTFVTQGSVVANSGVSTSAGDFSGDATFASGKGVVQAVAIITPSVNMTPAAASNMSATVNRFVAGSPTLAAGHLPAASTTTVGKEYKVLNEGSNPVLVFGTGSDTINATAAGTPHSCAAGKTCDCLGKAATAWQCGTK